MRVLGLSAFYHDASAALVEDGQVVAAAAEERFTLQKHDANFPKFAIEFCLEKAKISPQELDAVVFYEEPHTKFTRVLASTLATFPYGSHAFVNSMSSWLGSKLWIHDHISKRLDLHPRKIQMMPHHLSHAVQAFATSPFNEAAILVVDAVGEWSSTSLTYGIFYNDRLELRPLGSISYPHSIGLVYAAFTAFLGFKVNDGECSTMALSSFGRPRYVEEVRKVLTTQSDGTYHVDPCYFQFERFDRPPWTQKFLSLFGVPRNFKQPLSFDCFSQEKQDDVNPGDQQKYADIAASLQVVLEETLLALTRKLACSVTTKNLCFAGGVALNCVANSYLAQKGPFPNLFIPPDPGDGGAALGAALYGYYGIGGTTLNRQTLSPYLGKEYNEGSLVEMLHHAQPEHWIRHRMIGTPQPKGMKLSITQFDDFDQIVANIVDDLRSKKIVGWFQGRFENGPRALGNRSILMDPGNIAGARRLSRHIKSRAPYRPYALSFAEEDAVKIIDYEPPSFPAHWMQTTQPVADKMREKVAAGTHIDGTTRSQICSEKENPRFHKLLTAYGESSGVAALLNTSFNSSGFPMVASPSEALLQFIQTDMDTLTLNNTVIRNQI